MADISFTAANVQAANANTVKATGISGGAINIGQAVYLDPATGQIKVAQANSANPTHAPNLVGVALDTVAGANQPITYATFGDVTFGSGLVTGTVYVLAGDNPGAIWGAAEIVSTNFVAVIGVATSSSNMRIAPIPTSAQKP